MHFADNHTQNIQSKQTVFSHYKPCIPTIFTD